MATRHHVLFRDINAWLPGGQVTFTSIVCVRVSVSFLSATKSALDPPFGMHLTREGPFETKDYSNLKS